MSSEQIQSKAAPEARHTAQDEGKQAKAAPAPTQSAPPVLRLTDWAMI